MLQSLQLMLQEVERIIMSCVKSRQQQAAYRKACIKEMMTVGITYLIKAFLYESMMMRYEVLIQV